MTLYEICNEIARIEVQLSYGLIDFSYDNLMAAMKPGHPADLLDDVLSQIGCDVYAGNPVDLERVKEWYEDLKDFRSAFEIKELDTSIKHVSEYIEEQEGTNNA